MKVITNITLRVGKGKDHTYAEPGTEVELSDSDAQALIALGYVQPKGGKTTKAAADTTPSLEDIADAIDQLTEKDFKDGVPIVKSLERILKTSITAAQRDEAWAKVEADRKAAEK